MKLSDKELNKAIEEVKKSLTKQKEILSRHGVDISEQWKEMQKSVKK